MGLPRRRMESCEMLWTRAQYCTLAFVPGCALSGDRRCFTSRLCIISSQRCIHPPLSSTATNSMAGLLRFFSPPDLSAILLPPDFLRDNSAYTQTQPYQRCGLFLARWIKFTRMILLSRGQIPFVIHRVWFRFQQSADEGQCMWPRSDHDHVQASFSLGLLTTLLTPSFLHRLLGLVL